MLRALGGLLVLVALFVGLVALVVDSDAGHRFIADRVGELRPANGLRIHIGRLDGSIWRTARIRDLRLSDPRGVFLEAPEVELSWRPLRWLHNRLWVDRLVSPLVVLKRLPALRQTGRERPILPSYGVHLGRVDLQLRLEPGVAGPTRRAARIVGAADTGSGRARVRLAAAAGAGDRLTLLLDAEPDRDAFVLRAGLRSPAGGTVPGLFGSRRPLRLAIDGTGRWTGWDGRALLDVGAARVADLSLRAARGRYGLSGRIAPDPLVAGKARALLGPAVAVAGDATFADRRLAGTLRLRSPALLLRAQGGLDLSRSAFDRLRIDLALKEPRAAVPSMTGEDIRLATVLDGPFSDAAFRYALTSPHVAFDRTGFDGVRLEGAGRIGGTPQPLPIRVSAKAVTGVDAQTGSILHALSVEGVLRVSPGRIAGDGLRLRSDKLSGTLAVKLDLATGRYLVSLSGGLNRYLIPNLGIVDVQTELRATPAVNGRQLVLAGHGRAWVRRFDNPFLRGLAGGLPSVETDLVRTPDGVLHLGAVRLVAPAIRITGTGTRRVDGSFQFSGAGTQAVYGPFRLALDGPIDHPQVRLALDHPVDALGLSAVQLALDPVDGGFSMRANGGSTLGPFTLAGSVQTPLNQPATIRVDALAVTGTRAAGVLTADTAGVSGRLAVAGGGLSGAVDFATANTLQRILVHLAMTDAHLAGAAGLDVRRGQADADVLLDPKATRVDATVATQGLRRGSVFLARAVLNARVAGDRGTVRASVSGSRGKAFSAQTQVDFVPDRTVIRGAGQVDGQPVALTAPAILRRDGDAWQLLPAALTYGGGSLTLSGRFGGGAQTVDAGLSAVPLTVLDVIRPGLALSGAASGRLHLAQAAPGAPPSARATLRVRGLARAGLLSSSTPVDLGLDALLDGDRAAMRAVAASGGAVIGRAQAALGPLPSGATLADRVARAPVFGQLRYSGPADTLWRLAGVTGVDLSGPLAIAADVGGRFDRPLIRGSLATAALRVESTTLGTVVDGIRARGRFDGSRLVVDQFTGGTKGGGTVAGRLSVDFAAAHGLGIDATLDAAHAALIARDDLAATVTGPIAIHSDGQGGTVKGTVRLDRASYQLGKAAAAGVPRLAVTEVNRPADVESDAPAAPWTLALHIDAPGQLVVRGLGLDSEWRTGLQVTGAADNPEVTGRADLIRGSVQFAGRRFDLTRGIIRFTGAQPVDPALDLVADANVQGLSASIRVAGTSSKPELSVTSTPALPEDELLSRLLFGTSLGNLSAPEALQLAAAVNSLRTGGRGGGLDPINAVRRVARLDRLRIEGADVTTGQKTSVAAGKYIGRRTYVELVTDGQGYSATRLEFQVTRWLSLLATISTIGRQSGSVRISKDY